MTITKRLLEMSPRPKLRLSEIERLIKKHRVLTPVPSRRILVGWCEDGTFETAPHRTGEPWLVYEDSFLNWVKSLDG
jgi:hypothetical protein